MLSRTSTRVFALCSSLALVTFLSAQAPDDARILAPHKPIPQRVPPISFPNEQPEPRSVVGGPWMLDPNMRSTIYLRNGDETARLATTPVL